MIHQKRSAPLTLVVLALALLLMLSGCGSSAPEPVAEPPTATAVPTPDLPAGWVRHQGGDFSVALPEDWQIKEFSQGDSEALFAELQKTNPQMAEVIGSAEQLQGVALWAFAPLAENTDFVDNLNIRRTPLEGQEVGDLEEVTGVLVDQYRQYNFEDVSAEAGLEIGGHPAAYATYRMPLATADGGQVMIQGHQYLVVTDSDFWILSYSFGPDSTAADVHEESGNSFETN